MTFPFGRLSRRGWRMRIGVYGSVQRTKMLLPHRVVFIEIRLIGRKPARVQVGSNLFIVSITCGDIAFRLRPKTCHRLSYATICPDDPLVRFSADRTISRSGCWYCIAALTSRCPIVFITAARLPVLVSTRVP